MMLRNNWNTTGDHMGQNLSFIELVNLKLFDWNNNLYSVYLRNNLGGILRGFVNQDPKAGTSSVQ